ncbi:MAG: eukaryotic-like serine/threonine-protein kinase [Pseudonocardiales bacterium]|nr:eukaryotic-like serine/threonine-protein kinase [Pseudonocardiales bacterium]
MGALVALVGGALSFLQAIFGPDVCPGSWAWTTTALGVFVGLVPTAGAVTVALLRRGSGPARSGGGALVPVIGLVTCGLLPWLMFNATGAVFRAPRLAGAGLTPADRATLAEASCLGMSQRAYLGSASVSDALGHGAVRTALFAAPLVFFPVVAAFFVWVQARIALRRGPKSPGRYFWLPLLLVALLTGRLPAGSTAHLWFGVLLASVAGVFIVLLVPAPAPVRRRPVVPSVRAIPTQRPATSPRSAPNAHSAPRAAPPPKAAPAKPAPAKPAKKAPPPAAKSPGPAPAKAAPVARPNPVVPAQRVGQAPGKVQQPAHNRSKVPAHAQPGGQPSQAIAGAKAWAANALANAGLAGGWANGAWRDRLFGPPAEAPRPSAGRPGAPAQPASAPLAADPGPLPTGAAVPKPRPPATLVESPSSAVRRFDLIRQLGAGGFGGVWLANDHRLGKRVAVKAAHAPDEDTELRIRREARALGAVAHPNCVRILDLVDSQSDAGLAGLRGLVIVMEYVDGQSLGELVTARGPVDDVAAARIWLRSAGALAAAHHQGVLHRDVKPSNVVLDAWGEPHLIDFGIARARGDMTLTMHGMVIGTPDFLAPETARGDRATPSSDAWQLAATISFALTGAPPRGDHTNAVSGLRAAAASTAPSNMPLASVHRQLLSACLATDPAARPSLADVRRTLEQWLSARPAPGATGRPFTAVPPRQRTRG